MVGLRKIDSSRQHLVRGQGRASDWIDHKRFYNALIKINEAHVILDDEGSILTNKALEKATQSARQHLQNENLEKTSRSIRDHVNYGSVSDVIEASALLLLGISEGHLKNQDLVYHALITLLPKDKIFQGRINEIARLDLRGRLAYELAHQLLVNRNLTVPKHAQETHIVNYPIKYLIKLGGFHLVNACSLLLTGAEQTTYPIKTKHLINAIKAISNEGDFPELQRLLPDLEKLYGENQEKEFINTKVVCAKIQNYNEE